jgi:hypothetical protein
MIGLCCILDPGETNDPLKYFSRAYESYVKCAGKVNRMLATRTMLLAATYLAGVGRHQVGRAGPGSALTPQDAYCACFSAAPEGAGSGRCLPAAPTCPSVRPASCRRRAPQAANHVLMRAHFEEENARAALLLEQAAFALLALRPPMVRGLGRLDRRGNSHLRLACSMRRVCASCGRICALLPACWQPRRTQR